jgi:hypothetical protein
MRFGIHYDEGGEERRETGEGKRGKEKWEGEVGRRSGKEKWEGKQGGRMRIGQSEERDG